MVQRKTLLIMRKRTQARELALQCLYQIDITKDSIEESLDNFWLNIRVKDEIKEYADSLIKGARENLEKIDSLIKEHARNWEISRMATIDRNILRICTFELLFQENVPPKVAINEAIELAKKYGDVKSSKFVNGVMDNIRISLQKSAEA